MSQNRTTLLNPTFNFGIDVSVCTRVHTINEYGETESEDAFTVTKAVWCEMGYRQIRTKEGRKLVEIVEVHLLPDFDGLVPGQDYFIKDEIRYRITEYLGMDRVVGVVQYTLTREDQ